MNAPIFFQKIAPGIFSKSDIAPVSPLLPPPAIASKPLKRTKLWELQDKYHCPIIGSCLSIEELVKFSRRFSFGVSLRDEFSMHVELAGRSSTRNVVSEAIQKRLDRKYQACLVVFDRARTDAEVLSQWKAHYVRGEVPGAMWAALTHKLASDDTRQLIYRNVHMLSHQMGAGLTTDVRRLVSLEKENGELKSVIEIEQRNRANVTKVMLEERQSLQKTREGTDSDQAEISMLQERLATYESGKAMIEMGRRLLRLQESLDQQSIMSQRNIAIEKKLEALKADLVSLRDERDQLTNERDALERILISPDTGNNECDQQCNSCSLQGKTRCVLYVGGRTSLVAQYRSIAERLGIRLIHHDGGMEESVSRLPDLINSADAVVCPTDCVSHNAYYRLKRHCKLNGKPCLLFKGAGISSFAVALSNLLGTQPVISLKTINPHS